MAASSPLLELVGPDLGPEEDAPNDVVRARDFARDIVAPAGQVVERLEPEDIDAARSLVCALVTQAGREGLTRLGPPRALGGALPSADDEALMIEELATADAAIAALLVLAPSPFRWAASAGPPSLVAEVAAPYFSGARPGWIGCRAPAAGAKRLHARARGDGWTLSGETPALAGAAIATHALVPCTIADGPRRAAAFVALASDGVTRSMPPPDAGLRGLSRARLRFDDVQLGADCLVTAVPGSRPLTLDVRARAASGLVAFGIGRAAYEGALRWAREGAWIDDARATGDHVRPGLYRMFGVLEATRALVHAAYRSAHAGALDDDASALAQVRASSAFAAGAALEVAQTAAQLCGAGAVVFLDGSSFEPRKLLRDAQTIRH